MKAVSFSSSLHIDLNGDKHSLIPYIQNYHDVDDEMVLDELYSVQSAIEMALFEAFVDYGITG